MKIAITGSTGLVGEAAVVYFQRNGVQVTRLIRPTTKMANYQDVITWDYQKKVIDLKRLEGFDVVIHLAGANIADQRWTPEYKEIIRRSRVDSTQFLCDALAKLRHPPKVFLCASAVGYYGDGSAEVEFNEHTPRGKGFLGEVCHQWEQAAAALESSPKTRVVYMRLGAILSSKGGALVKMMPIFKLGLGGNIGNGQQMFSWIALDEIPRIMDYLIQNPLAKGVVNLTAPQAVTNAEFTKVLGRVLHRPVILPLPAFAAKIMFGEMGEALLLGGAKVAPQKLIGLGYTFQYPDIETALKNLIV
ncbi:MAG: TIGR01777 family protein [Candidatus Omnitrophica bacterium]|nr:TIGR01777 family protein [Candidatus Omnitrophota bacterium]